MANPELVVDNTEAICFPEPQLKIDSPGGPIAVRYRCEKCGEVGQAFEGPHSYFVKLREMAEQQFLAEQACDAAKPSAMADAEAERAEDEASDNEKEPDNDEEPDEEPPVEEPDAIEDWETSFAHAAGDMLQKIARELPPSVLIHALYCALGDDERPFAGEWAETFGPGWGMMSDDEKPRLQKMTGMLVAEMGNMMAAEAHADWHMAWATPLATRLDILVRCVTDGLHEALCRNRGETPVGEWPADTMAMIAASGVATRAERKHLVHELRVEFSRHALADTLGDMPASGPLTEDQFSRLAFVTAISASWSSFVAPLQERVAAELGRRFEIVDAVDKGR